MGSQRLIGSSLVNRNLSPSVESSAIQEGTRHGEREPDKTTSEAVSSNDNISSINQQANTTQLAEPSIDAPPSVRRLAPSLDSCAIPEEIHHTEQKHNQTLLDCLLSVDTSYSADQQADTMPQSVLVLVYTYDRNHRITTLMTTSQVQHLIVSIVALPLSFVANPPPVKLFSYIDTSILV